MSAKRVQVAAAPPMFNPVERAIKHCYLTSDSRWVSSETKIRLGTKPFKQTSLWTYYNVQEIVSDKIYTDFIGKMPKLPGASLQERKAAVIGAAEASQTASSLAAKFNSEGAPQAIDFVAVCMMEIRLKGLEGLVFTCETVIEGQGKFTQHSLVEGIPTSTRLTPQAFSHFTFDRSAGDFVICGVEGWGNFFTSPAIHTSNGGFYGHTDLSTKGIASFLSHHTCGVICAMLNLPRLEQGCPAEPWSEDEVTLKMAQLNLQRKRDPSVADLHVDEIDATYSLISSASAFLSNIHPTSPNSHSSSPSFPTFSLEDDLPMPSTFTSTKSLLAERHLSPEELSPVDRFLSEKKISSGNLLEAVPYESPQSILSTMTIRMNPTQLQPPATPHAADPQDHVRLLKENLSLVKRQLSVANVASSLKDNEISMLKERLTGMNISSTSPDGFADVYSLLQQVQSDLTSHANMVEKHRRETDRLRRMTDNDTDSDFKIQISRQISQLLKELNTLHSEAKTQSLLYLENVRRAHAHHITELQTAEWQNRELKDEIQMLNVEIESRRASPPPPAPPPQFDATEKFENFKKFSSLNDEIVNLKGKVEEQRGVIQKQQHAIDTQQKALLTRHAFMDSNSKIDGVGKLEEIRMQFENAKLEAEMANSRAEKEAQKNLILEKRVRSLSQALQEKNSKNFSDESLSKTGDISEFERQTSVGNFPHNFDLEPSHSFDSNSLRQNPDRPSDRFSRFMKAHNIQSDPARSLDEASSIPRYEPENKNNFSAPNTRRSEPGSNFIANYNPEPSFQSRSEPHIGSPNRVPPYTSRSPAASPRHPPAAHTFTRTDLQSAFNHQEHSQSDNRTVTHQPHARPRSAQSQPYISTGASFDGARRTPTEYGSETQRYLPGQGSSSNIYAPQMYPKSYAPAASLQYANSNLRSGGNTPRQHSFPAPPISSSLTQTATNRNGNSLYAHPQERGQTDQRNSKISESTAYLRC